MDNLVRFEGKPLEKLIDVVSNAVGDLLKPWQIVREAKAQAKSESIIAIEQAKTKAIIEGDAEKAQYLDTINERLIKKEKRRQKNIEEVVSTAGKILEAEKDVSNEPVNPDWVTRFFDIVQDVSDNEMRILWGQILAGEIKQPKSYSLRTLETLRNMTKDEAELFQKVAQFVLIQRDAFILSSEDILNKFGITYSDISKLIEIGLIQPGDFVTKNYSSQQTRETSIGIVYDDIVLIVALQANAKKVSIPIRLLTIPGKELVKLIKIYPNIEYIKELAITIKKNTNAKVSYSKILGIDKSGSIHYNPLDMEEL